MATSTIQAERTLLWTNPNPTSNFSPQTITVQDMSPYSYICFEVGDTSSLCVNRVISERGKTTSIGYLGKSSGNGPHLMVREVTYVSNKSLSFSDGAMLWAPGEISNNDVAIPQKIYGLK